MLLLAVAVSGYADPPLPVIPNRTTNVVVNFSAKGDGSTDNAGSINAAIAAINAAGGGTVEIPANGTLSTYECGTITMLSSVNLQIDSGAKLQMFPMSTWISNYGSSTPFINGTSLTDVEISGSGIIDGQGTNWWCCPLAGTRPNFVEFSSCTRVLIQNVTLQNPPTFHIYLKNSDTSVTVQGITINTPYDSHNTDGFDISSTNVLIRNCSISTGDDDVEIGGTDDAATDITISNCTFGTGHGVSMGSKIAGGVNNVIVSNCSWNGTEYGLKIKSDYGSGGLVQNIKYCDMTMTNVNFPIAFYMDYAILGSPSDDINITPANAASDSGSFTSTTPIYQNITISNLTAVGNSGIQGPGNIAGIIYGKPVSPVSNVTLCKVNIQGRTSDGTFCIYHARNIQIIDSNLTAPSSGTNTLTLYNATVTITNSAPNANLVTLGGLGSPSNTVLAFFNSQANITNPSLDNPNPNLTLAASTLTVNNVLQLGSSSTLNFGLGTTATKIADTGSLTLGGTFNIFDAGGFTTTSYTLFTYGGPLTYNTVTIGSKPNASYTYTVDTNTAGVVKLDVTTSCSVGAAGSITGSSSVNAGASGVAYSISSVSGATGYAWTVPSGASVASGQGTTSITVNYACSATSGSVGVTPTNSTCSGTSSSQPVTVTSVGAAGAITGSSSVNAGASGVAYSISSVSGATTYTWTVPSGASIASGQGTTSITVNYSCSAVSGTVQVTPDNANGCTGTAKSLSVTVTGVGVAGSISGPTAVCAGQTGAGYSISSVSGATTYTWTVPSGATVASGQGSTSILVNWGSTAGNVTVTPANANGCTGSGSSLSVAITSPAVFNVTGGGSYCAASGGVTVGLDGSESTADYLLELNGTPTGTLVAGTGSAISFTGQTVVGTYTVIASNVTSGCTATMNGSASVTPVDPFTCWQEIYGITNCAVCDGNSSYTGDGMSNTNKFLAGFNPTNAAAYLHVISVAEANGTNIVVTYLGANGDSTSPLGSLTYTNILDYTTGTANGSYSNINFTSTGQTNILSGGNGLGVVTNMIDYSGATNIPSRYYRVRVLLP